MYGSSRPLGISFPHCESFSQIFACRFGFENYRESTRFIFVPINISTCGFFLLFFYTFFSFLSPVEGASSDPFRWESNSRLNNVTQKIHLLFPALVSEWHLVQHELTSTAPQGTGPNTAIIIRILIKMCILPLADCAF